MKLFDWVIVGSLFFVVVILLVLTGASVRRATERIAVLEAAVSDSVVEEPTEEDDLVDVARTLLHEVVCLYESGPVLLEGADSLTDLPRGYWECTESYVETRAVLSKFSTTARRIEHACAYVFHVTKSDALGQFPRALLEFRRTLDVCHTYFQYREQWEMQTSSSPDPEEVVAPLPDVVP